MADEVAMSEEQELDALLCSMEQNDQISSHCSASSHDSDMFGEVGNNFRVPFVNASGQQSIDTPYGSDDDEYDNIFMDVIQQESRTSNQQQPDTCVEDQEMMDLS